MWKKALIFLVVIVCLTVIMLVIKNNKEEKLISVSSEMTKKPTSVVTPIMTPEQTPIPESTETPFYVLAPTTLMSFEELVGDNQVYLDYEDIKNKQSPDTYKVVINIYYQIITVFKKDDNGNFTVPVRYILCSTGVDEDGNSTPVGEYKVGPIKDRFGEFNSYGGRLFAQYWTQLMSNYYLHSILYGRRDAYYYKPYSYENLGEKASHGCIRMFVPDARWIWYNIAPGTEIEVIQGEKDWENERIKNLFKLLLPSLPEERPDCLKKGGTIPVTEAWPGYEGWITPTIKQKIRQESILADKTVPPEDQK